MTPEEMQKRSSEKVKQIQELMKLLNVTVEAKERVSPDGFIEKMVFWIDHEKYPAAPTEADGKAPAEDTKGEAKDEAESETEPAEEAKVE